MARVVRCVVILTVFALLVVTLWDLATRSGGALENVAIAAGTVWVFSVTVAALDMVHREPWADPFSSGDPSSSVASLPLEDVDRGDRS